MTLMKTHQCSRAEALKKIKCYKCQKRGHFAKEGGDDYSDEEISDEETKKPQAKGKSKNKSHRPYVAHLSYNENPGKYRAYQAVYRPRSCLIHLLHLSRSRIQYRSAATK